MNLNADENRSYQRNFVNKIPKMLPGTYSIRWFFDSEPSVPRIARKFYEEVKKGTYPRVTLVGKKSSEGYLVV